MVSKRANSIQHDRPAGELFRGGTCAAPLFYMEVQMKKYVPPPMRGIESFVAAEDVIKKYEAVGILVGGVAINLYQNKIPRKPIGKDVDILIADESMRNFPVQWEKGIDWWVSSKSTNRPSNGTHIGLLWKFSLREGVQLPSGLYIPSPDLLVECCEWEMQAGLEMSSERQALIKSMRDCNPLAGVTVLDERSLELIKLDVSHIIETHPKKSEF